MAVPKAPAPRIAKVVVMRPASVKKQHPMHH
jgi:hypothetical protein